MFSSNDFGTFNLGKFDGIDDNDFITLNNAYMSNPLKGGDSEDVLVFKDFPNPYKKNDAVNSPAHYTRGKQEAIDIIEEAIQDAPEVKSGMLQAQALKYLLRLWLKDDPRQDAEKARWYLNRLIDTID